MEIVNTTPYLTACTVSTDQHGQDHLLAIMKATFSIPEYTLSPSLIEDDPLPLVDADIFEGDPEHSPVLFESDYALFKPQCDVLLNGVAYAPKAKPVQQVSIGIKVGRIKKVLNVIGDRVWECGAAGSHPSAPTPFTQKVISYALAFGGVDTSDSDPNKHVGYLDNPTGIGYHKTTQFEYIENRPVPCMEVFNRPIQSPSENYPPVSFGPMGRSWPARAKLAGTYDENWQKTQFPFLPKDFDDRYFQAAPEDQQTDYLTGGETVHLINLTPQGNAQFKIPVMKQKKVVFYFFDGNYKIADFHVDTLHLLPEQGLFTLTARASTPLYGDPFSCSKVIIGRGTKGWQRALANGKRYALSLAHLKKHEEEE